MAPFVVFYKRLGKGRFVVPAHGDTSGTTTLDAATFAELLRGAQTHSCRIHQTTPGSAIVG